MNTRIYHVSADILNTRMCPNYFRYPIRDRIGIYFAPVKLFGLLNSNFNKIAADVLTLINHDDT